MQIPEIDTICFLVNIFAITTTFDAVFLGLILFLRICRETRRFPIGVIYSPQYGYKFAFFSFTIKLYSHRYFEPWTALIMGAVCFKIRPGFSVGEKTIKYTCLNQKYFLRFIVYAFLDPVY